MDAVAGDAVTRETDSEDVSDFAASVSRAFAEIVDELSENVAAAYLFGSRARGMARKDSDVDIAVLYTQNPPRSLEGLGLDLSDRLQEELGLPVQVVILNRAPVDLVHRVLRDGILLMNRDPSHRVRFEVRARNEYFDLLPYLQRYRAARPEAR